MLYLGCPFWYYCRETGFLIAGTKVLGPECRHFNVLDTAVSAVVSEFEPVIWLLVPGASVFDSVHDTALEST